MNAIATMAAKEIREASRNRWIMAITVLLGGLALSLSFLGSAPTGTVGVGSLEVTIVSLASLTIFLLPLIALLLGFDAIVGESERGTLLLLLTYPLSRPQLLIGKFLGHAAVLCFATVVGYGIAGVAVAVREAEFSNSGHSSLRRFDWIIGSAWLRLSRVGLPRLRSSARSRRCGGRRGGDMVFFRPALRHGRARRPRRRSRALSVESDNQRPAFVQPGRCLSPSQSHSLPGGEPLGRDGRRLGGSFDRALGVSCGAGRVDCRAPDSGDHPVLARRSLT